MRRERERELQASAPKGLPWPLLLLFSSFVAMASVGSMFEIANRHALFGVIQPDNFLWFPILGLFAATGLPTAGALTPNALFACAAEPGCRFLLSQLKVVSILGLLAATGLHTAGASRRNMSSAAFLNAAIL